MKVKKTHQNKNRKNKEQIIFKSRILSQESIQPGLEYADDYVNFLIN